MLAISNAKFSIAQPQLATVISNTDPSGQGRVTVRFDWQMHDTTNFIRMMPPDAGGTDQVSQNRRYVAISKVCDQLKGSQIGLGGGAKNHMRSIQTKSGKM